MNNHIFFSKCNNTYLIEGLAGNPFAALHGWWAGSHLWLGFSLLFVFAPRSTCQRVTNNAVNICCVLAGTQPWLQNHTSLTKWRLSSCLQSPTTLQERVRVKLAMISKTNYYLYLYSRFRKNVVYRAKMCSFTGTTAFSWGQLTTWVTDDEKCN